MLGVIKLARRGSIFEKTYNDIRIALHCALDCAIHEALKQVRANEKKTTLQRVGLLKCL